jgi:hypothetical protein
MHLSHGCRPFCDYHNNYIRSYLTTGKSHLLNRTVSFVAMHKERYVLPVTISVTKVSGIGEDTMFMGILEVREWRVELEGQRVDCVTWFFAHPWSQALSTPEDTACMWVLFSGQVVATDPNYCDWWVRETPSFHM